MRELFFPTYGLLPRPVKFPKMPLCIPDFKIRIHVYYFGFHIEDMKLFIIELLMMKLHVHNM